MPRATVSINTDGTPIGTHIQLTDGELTDLGGRITSASHVRTVKEGRFVEVTLLLRLDELSGAEHPFELSAHPPRSI